LLTYAYTATHTSWFQPGQLNFEILASKVPLVPPAVSYCASDVAELQREVATIQGGKGVRLLGPLPHLPALALEAPHPLLLPLQSKKHSKGLGPNCL
jgi:hypothetical protein